MINTLFSCVQMLSCVCPPNNNVENKSMNPGDEKMSKWTIYPASVLLHTQHGKRFDLTDGQMKSDG
ncbi:MAG: hypothetical protein ACKPKO_08430, partial [Candidatus Fonsibacter sp.]